MSGKPRKCLHCGSVFTPEFPRGAAKMCSPECQKERRDEQYRASALRYYQRHLEKNRERNRERSLANRDRKRPYAREWTRQNADRLNAKRRALYAAKKAERTP